MKTIIEMAEDIGFWQEHINTWMCSSENIKELAQLAADAEAKRIHDEGMVTMGHMREKIAAAVLEERKACWRIAYRLAPYTGAAAAIRARDNDAP